MLIFIGVTWLSKYIQGDNVVPERRVEREEEK